MMIIEKTDDVDCKQKYREIGKLVDSWAVPQKIIT
jgi:hypothetical protein